MRATERMNLLEQIGTELQRRYTFSDIDAFLGAFEVDTRDYEYGGSKRVYVKEVLRFASEPLLVRIAGELGFGTSDGLAIEPPANWKDTTQLKLFISHISKD